MTSMTYNGNCCGAPCSMADSHKPDEPCWGRIEVADEYITDEDSYWIHACQGHWDQIACGQAYVPNPETKS